MADGAEFVGANTTFERFWPDALGASRLAFAANGYVHDVQASSIPLQI